MTTSSQLTYASIDLSRHNHRILLALADTQLRTALRMHLCGDGWQVDLASGNHALRSVAHRRPRVLLADLEAADFDPLLLLAAARDIAPWLPVVLCGEAEAMAALDPDLLCVLGVTATLSLPTKLDAIATKLRAVVSKQGVPLPLSVAASVEVKRNCVGEVSACPNEKSL